MENVTSQFMGIDLEKGGISGLAQMAVICFFICSFWVAYLWLITQIFPKPPLVKTIKNEKESILKYQYYLSCITSLLHAPVSAYGAGLVLYFGKGWTHTNKPLVWYEVPLIFWTTSFFIFDSYYGYVRKYLDFKMSIHHYSFILIAAHSIYQGKYSNELMIAQFLGEITNTPLMVMEILDFHQASQTSRTYTGLLFLVSFITIRTTILPYKIYELTFSGADIIILVMVNAMNALGLIWSYIMINKAGKILATTYPTVYIFQVFYKIVKALRPLQSAYYATVISVCIAFPFWVKINYNQSWF